MLQRLYSHVVEAIKPCCGGFTFFFFTDNNTTPTKVVLSCFSLLVGLWQYIHLVYCKCGGGRLFAALGGLWRLLLRPHTCAKVRQMRGKSGKRWEQIIQGYNKTN